MINAQGFPDDTPVFVISVAAELAGMHPQTLRQYDRLGLVNPGRTAGGGRRYSPRDVALLQTVRRLSDEGINLAGIKRIIELQEQVGAMQAQLVDLATELEFVTQQMAAAQAAVHASYRRDLVPIRESALAIWRPKSAQSPPANKNRTGRDTTNP